MAVLLAVATPSSAQAQERWAVTEFALGTTCAVLNLVYGPVKVVYALLGGTTGVAAWALTGGDREIGRTLIQPALRGDYVIVPDHLTLDEPLEFFGRDPLRSGSRW